MDLNTQLLCTFTNCTELDSVIAEIQSTYTLVFNKIYVLENVDDTNQLILTYNVQKHDHIPTTLLESTISVHRKKQTNTIYTINAINRLIEGQNNGVLDKTFKINWDELKNTILVTAYSKLKIVHTKLSHVISL